MDMLFSGLVIFSALFGAAQLKQYLKKMNISPELKLTLVFSGGLALTIVIIIVVYFFQFIKGGDPTLFNMLKIFGLGLLFTFGVSMMCLSED